MWVCILSPKWLILTRFFSIILVIVKYRVGKNDDSAKKKNLKRFFFCCRGYSRNRKWFLCGLKKTYYTVCFFWRDHWNSRKPVPIFYALNFLIVFSRKKHGNMFKISVISSFCSFKNFINETYLGNCLLCSLLMNMGRRRTFFCFPLWQFIWTSDLKSKSTFCSSKRHWSNPERKMRKSWK